MSDKATSKSTSQLATLIQMGKEQGYLTYAEVNDQLPASITESDQIEDIVQMLTDVGIKIFESAPDDDDILMMLTDAAGELSWNRLRLGWLMPESEQLVSENAQFVDRKLERMHGSRGSKVRKASRARSRRRKNGAGLKFDMDYGPFFGDGVGEGGVVVTETDADVAATFFTRASRSL